VVEGEGGLGGSSSGDGLRFGDGLGLDLSDVGLVLAGSGVDRVPVEVRVAGVLDPILLVGVLFCGVGVVQAIEDVLASLDVLAAAGASGLDCLRHVSLWVDTVSLRDRVSHGGTEVSSVDTPI
jgi:hypothetical protein